MLCIVEQARVDLAEVSLRFSFFLFGPVLGWRVCLCCSSGPPRWWNAAWAAPGLWWHFFFAVVFPSVMISRQRGCARAARFFSTRGVFTTDRMFAKDFQAALARALRCVAWAGRNLFVEVVGRAMCVWRSGGTRRLTIAAVPGRNGLFGEGGSWRR